METAPSLEWHWIGTNNPADMVFALIVKTDSVTTSNKPQREVIAFGAIPYSAPTQFKDLNAAFNSSHLNSIGMVNEDPTTGVGYYQFVGESIGPVETTFYFFPLKTAVQLQTPYQIRKWQGNHYWHPVIYDIWVETDNSFKQSSNTVVGNDVGVITAPTLYIRANYLQDIEEGTQFVEEKYLSAVQPIIPQHRVPDPQPVEVQANGASRSFPKALHEELYIPPTQSGSQQYLTNAATGSAIGGGTGEHFFTATNVTDRKPYTLSDEPVRDQLGVWERIKVKVIPPKKSEIVTN